MVQPARPLSPFLHYRWRHTNTLSILHRISGLLLSVGLLLLIYWLMAVAAGRHSYARASAVLSLGVFRLVYVCLLAVFAYHLVAGIRHLVWDTDRGLERAAARRSAWVVVVTAIVLVIVSAYFLWGHVS